MKKLLAVFFLITIVTFGGFILWAGIAAVPGPAAMLALQSDQQVVITDRNIYITFEPANLQPSTGLIFYPGGRVDYRAYAPILRQIAAQGYLVAVVPARLNLAFFSIEAGEPVLSDFPQIKVWAVGGHSLGGVAASYFAEKHPQVRGIIFLASYPADDKLKNSDTQMLSIYGSNDGLASGAMIEQNKTLMPASAQFSLIPGGNHAQFGDYGPQFGDNPATIAPEEQWQQTTDATVVFLQSLSH